MISEENKNRLEQIIQEIKDIFPDTTTRLVIKITADETQITDWHRYPDDLKKASISMRNIKGDFISSKSKS